MIILVEESSRGVSFLSSLDRACDLDTDLSASIERNKGLSKYLFYEFISNPCAVEKYRNSKRFNLFLKQSVLWYRNYRHLFLAGHLNLPLDNLSKEWGWTHMTWPEYWRDRFVFQKGLVWQKII